MSKIFLKMVAVAAAIAMTASMLAGCGSSANKEEGKQASSSESSKASSTEAPAPKPVTITWFGALLSANDITTGIQDDAIMTRIKEKTGVTIDFTPCLGVSDFNEKAGILLASNDLPDVMTTGDTAIRTKAIKAKAAIPLDELLKTHGKNLQKNAAYALKVSKLLKSDETNTLYLIPGWVNSSDAFGNNANLNYNIRWDLYKKLGQPKISSYDDLLKLMEDMVKLEPATKDGKKNYGIGMFLAESWAHLMIDKSVSAEKGMVCLGQSDVYLDMANDKIVGRVTNPDSTFWMGMQLYNKAYRKGLLDTESATLKFGDFINKAKLGRYMVAECNWMLGGADANFIAEGTPEKGYVPLLVEPNADYNYFGTENPAGTQFHTFITTACKTPERAMDVIDFLASAEGAELMLNGTEGKYWTKVNGVPTRTEEMIKTLQTDPDARKKTALGKYYNMQILAGKNPDNDWNMDFGLHAQAIQASATQVQKDFCSVMGVATVMDYVKKGRQHYTVNTAILGAIAPKAGSELEVKINKSKAYVEANYAKVIFQKTENDFNAAKAKFIEDLKKLGSEEETKYYAEQYEALKAQLK